MLLLFDIDATLLTTTRAGVRAMGIAGRELFGDGFDENRVEYSGRLDPLIIGDLLRGHDRPVGAGEIEAFRGAYGRHLETVLATPGVAEPCPGVEALLDALEAEAGRHATLGLLTGNFPETGALKLRAAGLDPGRFPVQAWGSDSPHDPPSRDHLPPVAMERYLGLTGAAIEGERTAIIGDTPHDVACAHAHGCRALAVATGLFTEAQLDEAGADLTVATLEDTPRLVEWLLAPLMAGDA